MEDKVLATLHAHAYTQTAPVIIQSFETNNLRYLRGTIGRSSNIGLLQLLGGAQMALPDAGTGDAPKTYGQMITPDGLKQVATYADAIGPDIRSIIRWMRSNAWARPPAWCATHMRPGCRCSRIPSVRKIIFCPPTTAAAAR